MRKRLTKAEVKAINALDNRLRRLAAEMEDRDVELKYGNGTVVDQLGCACAALETILQEY